MTLLWIAIAIAALVLIVGYFVLQRAATGRRDTRQVLEPQGDVITDLKEGIVLTLVTYRGARDSRLHVSAWGMPYSECYCFRPAEIPRPSGIALDIPGKG